MLKIWLQILIIETYSFWNSLSKIENHFDLLIVMLYHICCLVSLITNLQYNVNIESLSMCSSQKITICMLHS